MKRIVLFLFATVFFGSSCKVFKGDQTNSQTSVSEILPTVSLNAWPYEPQSILLPNTQRAFKGPNGKSNTYQLVTLRRANADVVLAWVTMDEYNKIKELREKKKTDDALRIGDKVKGRQYTAQPLNTASIWTDKEMRKLGDAERRIAETYRNVQKYIIWENTAFEVSGTVKQKGENIVIELDGTTSGTTDSY